MIEVRKMSNEAKKVPVKAIAKARVAAKPVKQVPSKHVPAVHVLTTFDNLMDDFRRNFFESVASPYEWVSFEPIVPVREQLLIWLMKETGL